MSAEGDLDFRGTLGVAKDAGEDDLKKAYRRLAMQNHPDRNHGDAGAETLPDGRQPFGADEMLVEAGASV